MRMMAKGVVAMAMMSLVAVSSAGAQAPWLVFYSPSVVRVERTHGERMRKAFEVVTARPQDVAVTVADEGGTAKVWRTSALVVRLDKATGALDFRANDGTALLAEDGPAEIAERTYASGTRGAGVKQRWRLAPDRPVWGLGSVQNGTLDQRHVRNLRLQPENRDDGIPFACGLGGWGVYWNNFSPTVYDGDERGISFSSDVGGAEDYFFIAGGSLDGVVAAMRELTGAVPLNALWSYGFWQSRERYRTQEELLEVLRRYRRDGVPLDGIVQDWQYWGDDAHWNAFEFLAPGFSAPQAMLKEIHDAHCHFIISIWSSFGPETKAYADFDRAGCLLDLPTWPYRSKPFDAFSEKAREIYWRNAQPLYDCGIDGWWMDSTEPELIKAEPAHDDMPCALGRYRDVRLAYPYCTIANVHDRTKAHDPKKRVFILTRSATAGIQRTGAQTWSGDTDATWEALARQIPCGLNFALSGNPNWSCDLGGFVGKDRATFPELYVRWMQYGVFQPMMRSHGTTFPREFYLFGKPGEPVYDALVASVRLRYRMLPRIYSLAHETTQPGGMSFMRLVAADHPDDPRCWNAKGAFLFGRDFLVSPVTEAGCAVAKTYLPKGVWYDYFTGERVLGGGEHEKKLDLGTFPLYVRAGTVQVDGPQVQYVGERPWDDLAVTVYPGADGAFTLYEDAGDGYGYERGERTLIRLDWNEAAHALTIGPRAGCYDGMLAKRRFRVAKLGGKAKVIEYVGDKVVVPVD